MLEQQDFGVIDKYHIDEEILYDVKSTLDKFVLTCRIIHVGDGEGVPPYVEPPVIAGHEFSGRVVKLGRSVLIQKLYVSQFPFRSWCWRKTWSQNRRSDSF